MRGRKLLGPPGLGTRPMTGLAKKSLFGMLAGRLAGATVLDLYSGTGTLGIEALSRGAARVCFADCNRAVVNRLRRNIETCGAAGVSTIWAGNIESHLGEWLGELDRLVDVAFVDPPYPSARRWRWDRIIAKVFVPLAEGLADDGVVVLRLPDDITAPQTLGPLNRQRIKTYGQMTIAFYEKENPT